jgi:hypothetical protein
MRQIFSSPRLHNVERLEKVLEEAGVATRLTNRSSFLTGRPHFGYSERGNEREWPTLWVVQADDYGRARTILRETGLLEATRDTSYFSDLPAPSAPATPAQRASRVKLVVFGITMAIAILVVLKFAKIW